MKQKIGLVLGSFVFFAAFLSASHAVAQQTRAAAPQSNETYSLSRETVLQGTVVSFTAASTVPPIGAHVLLQTSAGQVDVHLGNARLLEGSHLTLRAGDSVRIVGEPMALGEGTYFAARIIQKGTQTVAVRNTRGFLLTQVSTLTPAQKEALRGVR
jgi:hypothetical protein